MLLNEQGKDEVHRFIIQMGRQLGSQMGTPVMEKFDVRCIPNK
jgi:hypothetical protein